MVFGEDAFPSYWIHCDSSPKDGNRSFRKNVDFLFAEFKQGCGTLAAADAHGFDAVLDALLLHPGQQRGTQFCAGAAEGMPQGDGPAMDVDLVHVDTEFADTVKGLGGKGFVDFKQVDVL